MTREEAITSIQDFMGWFKKDKQMYKALELAIKALSAEPCEDLISRQAALDELKELDDQDLYLPFHFKVILDELPSVTPKQRTGHWIKVDDEEPIAYDCSECGAMVSRRYKFCLNCGAKMEVSENG